MYTTDNAPFLDGDGIGFSISPAAPVNGKPPGSGTPNSAITVAVLGANPAAQVVLTELSYLTAPLFGLQRQTYTL